MKKIFLFLAAVIFLAGLSINATKVKRSIISSDEVFTDSLGSDVVLEPWTYTENFENRDLGAWASYPHWQDIAYDQNFRVNEIVPGDPNLCVVQKVTPYSNVDNYAGMQKLLDMYLVPGSKITFRYYLKTNMPAEFCKVRFAAGEYGKIDVTIPSPEINKWVWVTVDYNDFARQNQAIAGKDKVRIYALALLAKIPNADPAMPIYLGLDDITFQGARATAFQFAEPAMYKLPEFAQYIPKDHYNEGAAFNLKGSWPLNAKKVTLNVVSFTDQKKSFYKGELNKKGDAWSIKPLILNFPEGLYIGKLEAFDGAAKLSETQFTIHIAPKSLAGVHPRLLFDANKKKVMDERFKEERFKPLYDDLPKSAKTQRESNPVKTLIFDLDQFPDEDWLPTWSAWGSHIYNTGAALRANALAYTFHDDREAGQYAKDVLLTLSGWPNWTHPWQTKRGRFSEHRTGAWSHNMAEAYDLVYNLMTPDERMFVRKALMKNIIEGVHRMYIDDNNITGNTSNWIAMTVGGSLMNMAAIYEDGPETQNLEPYFTGAMLKFYTFINRVTDAKDGAWGEGLGYNNYSFTNMSYSVPSLKNVFNIDVTKPLAGEYNEFIWAGIVKDKQFFSFGDNSGRIGPVTNWAFLLNMQKEPRLGWYYNYLKTGETYQDVLYDTKNVPQDSPFDENPVKVFREVGTTVFKSGWETNDFSFVMRSGAFFNHQHMDQGSFWLADRGVDFIEERKNSSYYDDPLFQPSFIQPVAHSTILINGNQQSQRIGDHLKFAPGFDDHAFIGSFLDGKDAAFSNGDIGKLYWDKVKSLSRNVLFIKPRTLLMLDEAVPSGKDASVTLLYQTAFLDNITAGQKLSKITKDGVTLNFIHLSPGGIEAKAVETPHYLNTLLKDKQPLRKEGMLTVTARTSGNPLVMANMLTTTTGNSAPDISTETGDGFVKGLASGKKFAFSTKPGSIYKTDDMETDAVSMAWSADRTFVAMAKVFRKNGAVVLESDTPVTFELSSEGLKYYKHTAGKIMAGAAAKPTSVTLNGTPLKNIIYNADRKVVVIEVPEGEGIISIR